MHWHWSLLMVISNVSGKKVKKYNSGNVANSNRIENETGSQNIANMWHDHYKQLFNSVQIMFCPILGIILIPLIPWLPFMIRYVPSTSFLTTHLLDMMAWCPSISSMHHIVCMSWWQLFYSLWWNMGFFLNNLWQLCLFQFWKTRMVILQANQIIGQLLCLQWHPKSWR